MTKAELRQLIDAEIVGLGEVVNELTPATIDLFIDDGVRLVREWYLEPPRMQKVVVHQGGKSGSGYILKSDLAKPLNAIHHIYPTSQTVGGAFAWAEDLLGVDMMSEIIEGEGDYTDTIFTWTSYLKVSQGLESVTSYFDWEETETKILLTGVGLWTHGVLIYSAKVETLEDITDGKALDWVHNWAAAKTKFALGRTRGKFTSGGMNFETDASDLKMEAIDEIRSLREALLVLDNNFLPERG